MKADIKRAWSQWFVTPRDGARGGIAVASLKEALLFCAARGWEPVEHVLPRSIRERVK